MTDSPNQRFCKSCDSWYDARAASCYLCGADGPEHNEALKKATEMAALNGALATQMGYQKAEAAAESQFRQAHRVGGRAGMEIANRPVRGVAGYDKIYGSIKRQLQESGFGE